MRAHFAETDNFLSTFAKLGISYEPLRQEAAELAGALWREYCLNTRRRDRDRIVADFLIGAHAQFQADALLTRDRGFFSSHFKDLRFIDPTKG